jgi:hypothetical protein
MSDDTSNTVNPAVVPARVQARTERLTCAALTKAGGVCSASPTAASGYTRCFWHSTEVSELQKQAMRSMGGLSSRPTTLPAGTPDPSLRSPEEVTELLERVSGAVARGELAANVGRVLVDAARVALSAFDLNIAGELARLHALAAARREAFVVVEEG